MNHISLDARRFGSWLGDTRRDVTDCTDLRPEHIEVFKVRPYTRPGPSTRKPLNQISIKDPLVNLHCFFTGVAEWGRPDAPTRTPSFPGDLGTSSTSRHLRGLPTSCGAADPGYPVGNPLSRVSETPAPILAEA